VTAPRPAYPATVSDYAAFLRGINLGNRRVSNDELRTALERLGFAEVSVFRASGNVVFAGAGAPPGELADRICGGLSESLGFGIEAVLRSAEEVREIAQSAPFGEGTVGRAGGKLQVMLLNKAPTADVRAAALAHATEADRLAFGERELYWLPAGRTTDSELALRAVTRSLGLITQRTKSTLDEIARRYFDA